MSLVAYVDGHPELGARGRQHGGPRRRHRLCPVRRHPPPRVPGARDWRSRSRSAGQSPPRDRPWSSPGGTVVIAILGLAVAGVPFMTAGGIAIVVDRARHGARVGHAAAGVPRPRRAPDQPLRCPATQPTRDGGAGWRRWGAHVSRHAWVYAVAATVLLLALAAPVLVAAPGYPRRGHAARAAAPSAGPTTWSPTGSVRAQRPAGDRGRRRAGSRPSSSRCARRHRDGPGIAAVAPAEVDIDAGVATLRCLPHHRRRRTTQRVATIERLRAEVIPTVLADSPARAHVGGQTATLR